MVDVFFRGYGAWWSTEFNYCDIGPEQVTNSYEASGVFRLTDHDAMAYRHCKELVGIKTLLSSRHPDSELVRALKKPDVADPHAFLSFKSNVDEECYYFVISTIHTLLIAKPHPQASTEPLYNDPDKSSRLRALNQASLLWSNADRDDKTTWTDTKTVVSFLVGKGFSQTLAVRGASIVRPDWAESGRIPRE